MSLAEQVAIWSIVEIFQQINLWPLITRHLDKYKIEVLEVPFVINVPGLNVNCM